ncbi:hypothetical protein TNCV_396351 [Trichonephila clavipes]|nr:hypothetical protein TNCV_396351 [Trichonephila clavipes]
MVWEEGLIPPQTIELAIGPGLGSNPGEGSDICKCIVHFRHVVALNTRRATNPLERLMEEEERWEAPDNP